MIHYTHTANLGCFLLWLRSVKRNIRCNSIHTYLLFIEGSIYRTDVRCHPFTREKFTADYNKYEPMYQCTWFFFFANTPVTHRDNWQCTFTIDSWQCFPSPHSTEIRWKWKIFLLLFITVLFNFSSKEALFLKKRCNLNEKSDTDSKSIVFNR